MARNCTNCCLNYDFNVIEMMNMLKHHKNQSNHAKIIVQTMDLKT